MTLQRPGVIAALNDQFRAACQVDGPHGRWVWTRGIATGFDREVLPLILGRVATFREFTPDNDPHREHDFGSFDANGRRLFWKIDYYADATLTAGAEDARTCYRLLTIMLAEEY